MNASPDTVVATSTHSRIDWADPTANKNVTSDMPITVLRTTNGKFVAVEGIAMDDVAEPMTLVQRMKSSNLRRKCVVWATWDGVRRTGFWDNVPNRMPLYAAA